MRWKLPRLYANEKEPNPLAVIKLFTPWSNWTWYILEYDPESDGEDLCYGLIVGQDTELGYLMLSEMCDVRGPRGLQIERDLWFRPTPVRELAEYKENWGSGALNGQWQLKVADRASGEYTGTFVNWCIDATGPTALSGQPLVLSSVEGPAVSFQPTSYSGIGAALIPNLATSLAVRIQHIGAARTAA